MWREGARIRERGLACILELGLLGGGGDAVLWEPRLQRWAAPIDGELAQGELRAVAAANLGAPAQLAEGLHRQVMTECHGGAGTIGGTFIVACGSAGTG